jgi:eukaryotic-like serine/threonine-protein kinase
VNEWSSTRSIADPRAYLQQRVALLARVLLIFFAVAVVIGILGNITTKRGTVVAGDDVATMLVTASYGAGWLFARKGSRSIATMRTLEVGLIMLATVVFSAACFYVPMPVGADTMVAWGLTFVVSIVLMVRAALVPSTARFTLGIGLVAGAIVVSTSQAIWTPQVPSVAGEPKHVATGFSLVLMSGYVALSGVLSHVLHGLQTRVRRAMQLGQYTLEEKIGEGGMGTVYRARHAMLRRPTAIKLLRQDKTSEEAILRFELEVQQTSRLTHPNTVAIYDFGRTPDGVFYYAMEYLDGASLEELVELDGPQPAARVIHLLAQACEALAEAHDAGLIHRDIKPANIVVCERGGVPDVVKVVDFGLVKDIAAPKAAGLSLTTTITGTPMYLAPESITAPADVDGRTDLYALGCVGYFLMTGEPVFEGKTVVEVCGHHMHVAPMPPSERLGEAIDADLERVVLRCLEKAQDDRPQSAQALHDELMACNAAGHWSRASARAWWQNHGDSLQARTRGRRAALSPGTSALTIAVDARSG